MSNFRADFLENSIKNLIELQNFPKEVFDDSARRDFFRVIHSIKGTAQTFGLHNAARFSHELENLLADQRINEDKNLQNSLFEGIPFLILALREQNADFPASFVNKLRPLKSEGLPNRIILFSDLPFSIFQKLSANEITSLIHNFCAGNNIFSIAVFFEKSEFAVSYKILRDILSANGEIIAAFPNNEKISLEKVGFHLLFVSNRSVENLSDLMINFLPEIICFTCDKKTSNKLTEMFQEVDEYAQNLGKNVGLTVFANNVSLAEPLIAAIFEILLHLVRNATDHAFEDAGEIKIYLFVENGTLFLTFSDNGKGIDLEKVRRFAIEKNLISGDDVLNEQQTLELIFASELTTAQKVSEISGRGVGLDGVKNAVEKLNGKISVKSRKDFGTKFEVILPLGKN